MQEKKRKIDFQNGSHGGHLWFPIGTSLAIFDLQVTLMLPPKFQVNWLLGLGEEAKNRFSRWLPWRPSWIYDGIILGIFDLQVTLMLPTKFRVNWPFGSEEEAKNRFSRWLPWRTSWISDRHDFSYFWSTSSPCFLASLESISLSVQDEAKNRFSRWLPWWPSWISDRHNFSYFWSISHPNASYQVWSQLAFGFRSRSEK